MVKVLLLSVLVHVQCFFYPTRARAARGKVIEFVLLSLILSVFLQKNLRWCELATFRTSERV